MKGVSMYVLTYQPERFEPARPTAASAAYVYYSLSLASWVFVMHDGVGTLEMELVHLR
jgi:hypothetical protein